VNFIDLVAILVIVLAIAAGVRTGALPQVGGISGAIAGIALVLASGPLLVELVAPIDPVPRALIVLAVVLGAVAIGEAVGSGLGRGIARALGRGVLSSLDRMAGAFVGAAQALLVIWLAAGLIAVGPFPRFSEAVGQSVVVRTIDRYLPAPTELAGEVAQLLDDSRLPDVFVGLEPVPAPPVDRIDDPTARAIAERAQASTWRVSASACGAQLSGSSFVVANDYLVTNAHVVAGAGAIRVRGLDGGVADATVVLFDPDLDVAVLWAPGVRSPALRFASSDPQRGASGAVLGFPGGGPLVVVPAGVTGTYNAVGRDIYGSARVTRPILELRADVERGDSGGPLVLPDGTVGGVIFAESRTDPDVGYALAPTAVSVLIAPSIGRTSPVDTGACLR
jgi:S1-C subfamily serine protease/uncharacterized membrane protein required for colicin V production